MTIKRTLRFSDGSNDKEIFSKHLKAGRYRFKFQFAILNNALKNRNLVNVLIHDIKNKEIAASGKLPRKEFDSKSPYDKFHVDFFISEPSDIRAEIFLTSIGEVEISKVEIVRKVLPKQPISPIALFINHDRQLSGECTVHQGIAAIASYLESAGVDIHAVNTSQCDDEFILKQIQFKRYKYVGFFVTSNDTVIEYVKDLIRKIRIIIPDIQFLAGGPQATLGAAELLSRIPELKLCVRGEGEQTCLDIFRGETYDCILGLSYLKNGEILVNPERPLLPADKIPPSARHVYFETDWTAHSISTSRGCPHKCHFCIGHEIFGRSIRFKPLEVIEKELEWLYENEDHSKVVSINDDMFNMNKKRTLLLMEILRRFPFHYFPRGMRADRLDDQTVSAMANAGVVGTSIGIESADNSVLKAIHKGETIEDIEQGITHLRRYGIGIVAMFMIGNIGDTLETTKKTIDFAMKHKFEDLNMSCAIPFPGTELTQYVQDNKLLLNKPYVAASGVVNGNTTIFFETPEFPLQDRIKAVELALEAGLLRKG